MTRRAVTIGRIDRGQSRPAALSGNGQRPVSRFMLYSHDGFGLGHFRRNLVIAQALVEQSPGTSILLACAAEGLETFTLPAGVDVLRLPGLRKVENGLYVGRRLNIDATELERLRASLLTSAVARFRPHVLLVDKHPLGLGGELLPALALQRRQAGRSALGLRDVLDDRRATAGEWRKGALGQHVVELYQRVLVYGSRGLLNPLIGGLLPPQAGGMERFCGYVVGPTPRGAPVTDLPARDGRSLVLATVGGGEDGRPLLDSFLTASRQGEWRGIVVAGPQMDPGQWRGLLVRAERAGVAAFRSVPQVARWYPHVDALVSMGGYNSLLEAVTSGTPTVCVPRVRPRHEQLIRARAFAALGLVWLPAPESPGPDTLAAAIRDALAADRSVLAQRTRSSLELDGARRAAEELAALADGARPSEPRPARTAGSVDTPVSGRRPTVGSGVGR